jgi:hypothetical protein
MDFLVSALGVAVAFIVGIASAVFTLILESAFIIIGGLIVCFMLYIFGKSCDCCFTLLGGGDCACFVIVFGFGVLILFGLAANSTGPSSL